MKHVLQKAIERYALDIDGIHGIKHWRRVLENGLKLAPMTGADVIVVECFACLHDCCRQSEGIDKGHGKRAAEFARSIRGDLIGLTDAQFEFLYEACVDHENGRTEADITVMTCWDADRLDLGRVLKRPSPKYLCTQEAKGLELIEWACQRATLGQ